MLINKKISEALYKFKKLKEYEIETFEKIKDYDLFYDLPSNRDILGEFVDKLLDGSVFMYKNR